MPTLASSVLGSDDDEDADPYHHGVGPWDNMFSLAEAARLKQDGHAKHDPNHPFDFTTGQTKKKRRLTKGAAKGEEESFLEMKRNLPLQRGNHSHGYQDPIELGWCTLEQGRHAFDLYGRKLFFIGVAADEIGLWRILWSTCPALIRK